MNPGMIGVFIPIMGILLGMIAVITSYMTQTQKLKLKMIEAQRGSDAVSGETARELQRLKDRVAVLERLLTDDDRKLAGEIERLRREDARG